MSGIWRPLPQTSRVILLMVVVISLAFSTVPMQLTANMSEPSISPPRFSTTPLPSAPVGSAAPYDEQVGVTFTQNFSTLAFNVTAVAFTDNLIGPGYLVNGLTDRGYWYQVGLSYNWPMTDGSVNQGFSMNYEVFDPSQASIYPSNGGGIQPFNGTVKAGDSVLLSLSFSGGSVYMNSIDWQTKSSASQSFSAYNSNVFIGLPSRPAQNHFFSGLMTEQYHYDRYFGPGLPVAYSVTGSKITSAWMWMDEWNTNPNAFEVVFEANTTSPVSLSESVGHYFSSNGTAEIASSDRLVTGLTPVTFPSLVAGNQGAGRPGHSTFVNIAVEDSQGATLKFENLTVVTSFGKYNFTLQTPVSFGSSSGQYSLTIIIPANVALGTYNLTISVESWSYLDTQAQTWIPLQPGTLNETFLVTNTPPPSNPPSNPGPSPHPSGRGSSSSTNNTIFSPSSFLAAFRSTLLPIVLGYAAMGLLAVALVLRQEGRRSRAGPTLGLRFCANCGREITPETVGCPHCNSSVNSAATDPRLSLPGQETPRPVS